MNVMKKDVTDEYGDLIDPPRQPPIRQEPVPEQGIRDRTVHPPSPDPKIFIFKKILVPCMIFCLFILMLFMGWSLTPWNNNDSQGVQQEVTNSIGMEFVKIPEGEFMMGSPSDEGDRDNDEGPVHKVTIEESYYLGKYEVTQEQWREVMGSNPSYFKGDDLPVEKVSWTDAQMFIQKLNEMEGTNIYRLQSEAEWEYACFAGTTTRYYFGDDESRLGDYAWYLDNLDGQTHPVGQKKPNPWGLYDMHGNVWEWCQDEYHSNYDGARLMEVPGKVDITLSGLSEAAAGAAAPGSVGQRPVTGTFMASVATTSVFAS